MARLLALVLAVWVASVLVSWVVLVVRVLRSGDHDPNASVQEIVQAWMAAHSGSLEGVLVLALPSQAVFLAGCWLVARRAHEGPSRRLGLSPGRSTARDAFLCLLGTIGVQWAASVAGELAFRGPSEQMREVWKMLSAPTGTSAVAIGLVISIVPGFCEEILFRGLLMRGLLSKLDPFASIAISGALFALAHLDPQYAFTILPLGVWLGYVAWRSGSIRLSIACHTANNFSAILFGRMFGDPETGNLPSTPWMFAVGIALCACAALAVASLRRVSPAPRAV